ncbi:N-acetyltransferase [Apostasia shenzhenica]|uniref:N-acetyltransferase n=1 Tax=Apostasia shenzhenica TaxID=1088818 RepID=A0A2H9ZSQ6_9ASPA|nr:N-acetyltransferase [Apostasia shenzhenica]
MPQAKISTFFKPSYPKIQEMEAWELLSERKDGDSDLKSTGDDQVQLDCLKGKRVGSFSSSAGRKLNKRSYEQYYLDLGQSDFVLHTCSVCGLMYARGVEEDEQVHRKFHQEFNKGIQIKSWQNERVVLTPNINASRIVLVLRSDPPTQQHKVQKVANLMVKELGFNAEHLIHEHCKVYLFICGHRIVGCLVAEPIKTAYRVISGSSVNINSENCNVKLTATDSKMAITDFKETRPASLQFGDFKFHRDSLKKSRSKTGGKVDRWDAGAIICEEEAVTAHCGIRAIWVASSYRRKGIASQLLDAARYSFTGQMLEISQCAFSPPTSAGMAFASSYTNCRSFLVYKGDEARTKK